MKQNYLKLVCAAGVILAVSNSAMADPIVNGDFSQGTDHLQGWQTATADNGSVSYGGGGTMILATGDSANTAYPAVLSQGLDASNYTQASGFYDSSFAHVFFSNPILISATAISFDFNAVFSQVSNTNETPFSGNDHLDVVIYDQTDASKGGRVHLIDSSTLTNYFTTSLSGFLGDKVGFSFELVNEADGFASQVALSNIVITDSAPVTPPPPSSVPEPETAALMLLGLGLLGFKRKK